MDQSDDIRNTFEPLTEISFAKRWEKQLHRDIMAALPFEKRGVRKGLAGTSLWWGLGVCVILLSVGLAYLTAPAWFSTKTKTPDRLLSVHTNGGVMIEWQGGKGEFTVARSAEPNMLNAPFVQYVLVDGTQWVDDANDHAPALFYRVEEGKGGVFLR